MPTEMIVRIDTQKSIDVLKNAFAIPYPPKSAADVAQIVFFAATVKFAFVPLVAYTTIFAAAAAVRFDNRSDDHPTS